MHVANGVWLPDEAKQMLYMVGISSDKTSVASSCRQAQ